MTRYIACICISEDNSKAFTFSHVAEVTKSIFKTGKYLRQGNAGYASSRNGQFNVLYTNKFIQTQIKTNAA